MAGVAGAVAAGLAGVAGVAGVAVVCAKALAAIIGVTSAHIAISFFMLALLAVENFMAARHCRRCSFRNGRDAHYSTKRSMPEER